MSEPKTEYNAGDNNTSDAWMDEFVDRATNFLAGDPEAYQVKAPETEDDLMDELIGVMSEAACSVIDARKALLEATLELNSAKARYEDAKVDALVMGTITGKNAEEREARLASLLEVQIGNVRKAEAAWLKAKVELECSEDVVKSFDRMNTVMALHK